MSGEAASAFFKQISKLGAELRSLARVYLMQARPMTSTSINVPGIRVPAELLVKVSSLLFLLRDVRV